MNKALQWTLGISVTLIAFAIAFSLIAPFFFPNTYAHMDYGGMMGGGRGMMGGSSYGFGLMPFGGGMFLVPLLFLALIVGGIVVIVRALTPTSTTTAPKCAHCGKTVQAEWKACPYCGEKI